MSHTAPFRRKSPHPSNKRTSVRQSSHAAQRARLWAELTKQRALLLGNAHLLLIAYVDPGIYADPTDQASTEFDRDFALQVKTRTFDKLRRIENALQLLRTSNYGQCRRCRKEIPYERLEVQPDAIFCVPCLTLAEQDSVGN